MTRIFEKVHSLNICKIFKHQISLIQQSIDNNNIDPEIIQTPLEDLPLIISAIPESEIDKVPKLNLKVKINFFDKK